MEEKMKEQELANQPAQQDDFMQGIQDMIKNLLMDEIDNLQTAEIDKQLGIETPDGEGTGTAPHPMNITEIKKIVHTVQKFLDNVNVMVSQLEVGKIEYKQNDDKFLDDYLSTADDILEIAAFSTKDPLTGLSNRHGFENRLILEWNRAIREQLPLSLLVFGVDKLDHIEETYGSREKTTVLQILSRTLESAIKRSTDFVARWNDIEFAALLPITNAESAMIVAERIQNDIEKVDIPCMVTENGGKIMTYIGVCVQVPERHGKITDYINKTQNALNKAKEAGENRIIMDCEQ